MCILFSLNCFFLFLRYLIVVAQSPPLLKIKEEVLYSQDAISQVPTKISMSTHNLGVPAADYYLQNYQSSAMLPA